MSDAKTESKINVDALNQKKGRRTRKIEEYIKITQDRLAKSLEITKYLNEGLEVITNFPHKDGEVVVIKNKGTGIVVGIEWGEDNIAVNIDEQFANRFYAVVATQNGYEKVLLSEILPYNTTTKVLYEGKHE